MHFNFFFFQLRLICCQAGGCFCNSGRLQKLIYPNNQVFLDCGGWDTEMALVGKASFWSLECFGWLRAGDWSGGIIFTDPWDFFFFFLTIFIYWEQNKVRENTWTDLHWPWHQNMWNIKRMLTFRETINCFSFLFLHPWGPKCLKDYEREIYSKKSH